MAIKELNERTRVKDISVVFEDNVPEDALLVADSESAGSGDIPIGYFAKNKDLENVKESVDDLDKKKISKPQESENDLSKVKIVGIDKESSESKSIDGDILITDITISATEYAELEEKGKVDPSKKYFIYEDDE